MYNSVEERYEILIILENNELKKLQVPKKQCCYFY